MKGRKACLDGWAYANLVSCDVSHHSSASSLKFHKWPSAWVVAALLTQSSGNVFHCYGCGATWFVGRGGWDCTASIRDVGLQAWQFCETVLALKSLSNPDCV
jgi:hypothetical protein